MTDACDGGRVANLLGALALAVAEDVITATDAATGRPSSDTAALVAVSTTLDGTSQDLLGRVLGLTQTGTVRLVDRLVREGLIERRPGHDDRTHAIGVTAAGSQAAHDALAARRTATEAVLRALDVAERQQLTALLEKLLTAMTTSRAQSYRMCRLCETDVCEERPFCPVTRGADQTEAESG